MYFIVDKSIFYCPRDLWFGVHIDTGAIGFLNDSGCIYVEFVLHCSLRLLFLKIIFSRSFPNREKRHWPIIFN